MGGPNYVLGFACELLMLGKRFGPKMVGFFMVMI